jgi:CheY-like chemotaxis protein
LALESIISEVAGLGVKKIALGYPEGDSFQYRSEGQTLQGSIHPKLVFLANQLLFDQHQLTFSFAKVSAEIVHETIKGQTLLVANLTPEPEKKPKEGFHQSEEQEEKRSVVLVDDQRGFLKVLGKFMERKGWSVTSFSNSAEALAYLGNNDSTDLLICDYHIDTMDGLELVDKLKEILPDLPVVILSGDCRPEVKETLVQSGVSAFVQKQEDPRILMAWCNTLIEQKENESRH